MGAALTSRVILPTIYEAYSRTILAAGSFTSFDLSSGSHWTFTFIRSREAPCIFLPFTFSLFSRFDTLVRSELSQVRGTNFSGGEGITLLQDISCTFYNPNGSCIEQSGLGPSPATASRQPAHRPVT